MLDDETLSVGNYSQYDLSH